MIEDGKPLEAVTAADGCENDSKAAAIDKKPPFQPTHYPDLPACFAPPDEAWLDILESPCTFPPDVFSTVMDNLVKNPNLTSSHLFRADIFYDSDKDCMKSAGKQHSGLLNHLRSEYRPVPAQWPNMILARTVVRQMIPRNPRVDRSILQTCHFFEREHSTHHTGDRTDTLVLYIPHVADPSNMPFYHPSVLRLAFLHVFMHTTATGHLHLLYLPFSPSSSLDIQPTTLGSRLHRTGVSLLSTVHKHGQGFLAGYQKRVHHDLLIPQRRYQSTYARLKAKYGRALSQSWVEVTDPGKHVFEDLGIAAFLIELWRGMYADFEPKVEADQQATTHVSGAHEEKEQPEGQQLTSTTKPKWKGFVDIGCGNGVLVHVLLSEGCGPGWGFDARARKSWTALPGGGTMDALSRRVLVPSILQEHLPTDRTAEEAEKKVWHNGSFEPGRFLIANHADQLTLWTPLLAYLCGSGFVAIPCCSHDFAGARFRAPSGLRTSALGPGDNHNTDRASRKEHSQPPEAKSTSQGVEAGSLAPKSGTNKTMSAYASLCAYVAALATEVGFEAEAETLRIPSTRNVCIVGRRWKGGVEAAGEAQSSEKSARVVRIIEREMKRQIGDIAEDWAQKVEHLMRKPGSGH